MIVSLFLPHTNRRHEEYVFEMSESMVSVLISRKRYAKSMLGHIRGKRSILVLILWRKRSPSSPLLWSSSVTVQGSKAYLQSSSIKFIFRSLYSHRQSIKYQISSKEIISMGSSSRTCTTHCSHLCTHLSVPPSEGRSSTRRKHVASASARALGCRYYRGEARQSIPDVDQRLVHWMRPQRNGSAIQFAEEHVPFPTH